MDKSEKKVELLKRRVRYQWQKAVLLVRDVVTTPEKLFLLFAGSFGLLFVFVIPPMQSPDEQSHLYRSYQTSSMGIFAERFEEEGMVRYGTRLPQSMYEAGEELRNPVAGNPTLPFDTDLYQEYINKPLDEENTLMVKSEAVNVYSPVVYIPQAIGFGVGRIFDASPVIMIWLGRITNLVFWLVMVYFAIRMLPFAKWGLVVLALNPVTVTLSASLSGDVTSIALAFVFVSMIFASRKKPYKRLSTKQIILIAVLSAALCLTKPVNIFLLPLLLLIPKESFGSMPKKLIGCLIIGGVGLVLGGLWNISTKEILDIAVQDQKPGLGVSPSQQLHYIISQPIDYCMTVIHNYVIVDGTSAGNAVLSTYLGVFGWLDSSIPLWTQFLYFAGLMVAVLYQFGRGIAFSLWEKILMLTVFAMAFGAAITAMYMNYTPVAAKTFEGVQGRYFMPASIVLLGLFTGKKKLVSNYDKSIPWIIALVVTVVLLMTTYKLLARYY